MHIHSDTVTVGSSRTLDLSSDPSARSPVKGDLRLPLQVHRRQPSEPFLNLAVRFPTSAQPRTRPQKNVKMRCQSAPFRGLIAWVTPRGRASSDG